MGRILSYISECFYGKSEKYGSVGDLDTIPISRGFLEQVSRIHYGPLVRDRENRLRNSEEN